MVCRPTHTGKSYLVKILLYFGEGLVGQLDRVDALVREAEIQQNFYKVGGPVWFHISHGVLADPDDDVRIFQFFLRPGAVAVNT